MTHNDNRTVINMSKYHYLHNRDPKQEIQPALAGLWVQVGCYHFFADDGFGNMKRVDIGLSSMYYMDWKRISTF